MELPGTHPSHQYLKLSKEEMVIFRYASRSFDLPVGDSMDLLTI